MTIFVLLIASIVVTTNVLFRAQFAEEESRKLARTESELRITTEHGTERAAHPSFAILCVESWCRLPGFTLPVAAMFPGE